MNYHFRLLLMLGHWAPYENSHAKAGHNKQHPPNPGMKDTCTSHIYLYQFLLALSAQFTWEICYGRSTIMPLAPVGLQPTPPRCTSTGIVLLRDHHQHQEHSHILPTSRRRCKEQQWYQYTG